MKRIKYIKQTWFWNTKVHASLGKKCASSNGKGREVQGCINYVKTKAEEAKRRVFNDLYAIFTNIHIIAMVRERKTRD